MGKNWYTLLVLLHFIVSSPALLDGPIKHVVVLMEENRSFDHIFGWYPGANGLSDNDCNELIEDDGTVTTICVDKNAPDVNLCDPDHTTNGTTAKIFGVRAYERNTTKYPTMGGFIQWEYKRGKQDHNYCGVMSTFTTQDLPVINALAEEFVLMDRFFCDHPGPTWPNRLFALSATSRGLTETHSWFENTPGQLFSQETIFDQVAAANLSWHVYFEDTPWELFIATLAHNASKVIPMEEFYAAAANGSLPNFAWINPRIGADVTRGLMANDDHPDHDVGLGEQYYKDIYEALRASPQWNETLFIITFDEHGGFFDHVPPPSNVPPPDDSKSYPYEAKFDRLGLRVPTLLISPWVPKRLILSEPPCLQKPKPNSEYTLSSIIATTRKLLGMPTTPLTNRDAWAATFEHVLLSSPRLDCLKKLPAAPALNAKHSLEQQAALPLNDLQEHVLSSHAWLVGEPFPEHIHTQGQVAEYTQKTFKQHKSINQQWHDSRDKRLVHAVVVADGEFDQTLNHTWYCTRNSSLDYLTFYAHKGKTKMCLDYNITSHSVGVSVCYPNSTPSLNLAKAQHWMWEDDATIRPFYHQDLCLTTDVLSTVQQDGASIQQHAQLTVKKCVEDNVSQHWAWHGGPMPATGRKSGKISMGYYYVSIADSSSIFFVNPI